MLNYLALCLLPVAMAAVAFALLYPSDSRLGRLARRVGGLVARGWRWLRERLPGPLRRKQSHDPFQALTVQLRLERLASEIAELERGDQRFARAHHLRAAMAAYDDLLAEACRLAGAPVPEDETVPVRRVLEEAELRSRGWTW